MNRELIVLVLFLFIHVSLSINCFFYQYAGRKAKSARNEIKEEVKANKPLYKTEIIPSLTKSFNDILDIKIEKENPHRIRFFMKDTKDICLTLSHIKSIYYGSELEYCQKNSDVNYIDSKWIIAEDFIKAGNDKLEENKSSLFIVSSSIPKTYILIFPDKYVAKLKKMKLHWDIKLDIEQANGSQTTQLKEFFWEVMVPIGYVVDVITFPLQVIGGFIYIMIFGIK